MVTIRRESKQKTYWDQRIGPAAAVCESESARSKCEKANVEVRRKLPFRKLCFWSVRQKKPSCGRTCEWPKKCTRAIFAHCRRARTDWQFSTEFTCNRRRVLKSSTLAIQRVFLFEHSTCAMVYCSVPNWFHQRCRGFFHQFSILSVSDIVPDPFCALMYAVCIVSWYLRAQKQPCVFGVWLLCATCF